MEKRKEIIAQQIEAKIYDNEAFFKAVVEAKDAAELQKVLEANDIAITADEAEAYIAEGMKKIADYAKTHEDGELSEDDLSDVAGGGAVRGTLRLLGSCVVGAGYGALCGLCPAFDAGIPYVVGGLSIWTTSGYYKKGW